MNQQIQSPAFWVGVVGTIGGVIAGLYGKQIDDATVQAISFIAAGVCQIIGIWSTHQKKK